ncbi:MAG: phosphate/phosphite/phosphonate ABC transporter substrate-binding protein, partial [Syntrophobacteraceae bacterium]|nr:phosphate/phosphite/phosphonate ABC transporter substrate-binding protein [Syntrophobacteraceae bacterium]
MTKDPAHRLARRPSRWLTICTGLLALLFVCIAASLSAAGNPDELTTVRRLFRLAFSPGMFTEVKIDDARAAMKVWFLTIARERGVAIDPEPVIYGSLEEVLRGLQSAFVEGFGGTAEECWRLSKEVKLDRMVVSINGGRMTEEYLILVHRDSGMEGVADLRGRSLLVLQNPRMSLATVWLDTLLAQNGLETTPEFCSRVTIVNKLSQVVLPVFFRKSDACVVTRRGFQTMSELNPQVGKQLRVL